MTDIWDKNERSDVKMSKIWFIGVSDKLYPRFFLQ